MMNTMKNLGAALAVALVAAAFSAPASAAEKFLADRHADRGVECASCHKAGPAEAPDAKACLACHGDYAALKDRTKDVTPNPHYTHLLDQPCTECHQGHKASVNMCNGCHQFDYKVP